LGLEYEAQMVGQALNKKKGKEGAFLSTQARPMPGFFFLFFLVQPRAPISLLMLLSKHAATSAKIPSIFTQSNSQFLTSNLPNIKQTDY